MRKRLALILAAGALALAMLPGAAAAAPAPWAGDHPPDPCDDLRGSIGPDDPRIQFVIIYSIISEQFECEVVEFPE